jgi:hypothetical protein
MTLAKSESLDSLSALVIWRTSLIDYLVRLDLLRRTALATSSVIRHKTPKGITRIGIIPQPEGTQVLETSGDSRMTKIARTETKTLATKPIARYFSTKLVDSAEDLATGALLAGGLLAILLEYWLG